MSWDTARAGLSELTPSRAESQRFGADISRLTIGTGWRSHFASVRDLAAEARSRLASSNAEVVITRFPSEQTDFPALAVPEEWRMLPAGALMYWGTETDRYVPQQLPDGFSIAEMSADDRSDDDRSDDDRSDDDNSDEQGDGITPSDLATALDILADSFAGYTNHYAAHPNFDPERVTAGYVEWAESTLTSADSRAIVLRRGDSLIGVATVARSETDPCVEEIELAGIATEAQGRGSYRYLLDAVVRSATRRGIREVVISTQSHNIRVQRAWARAGLLPLFSVDTVYYVRPE